MSVVKILALDPGLSFAYALYRLEGRTLALVRYGCERYPGNPHGAAGREQVHAWAVDLLAPFASADEVCSDSELAGSGLATNVPALGAFEAAREFGREHGRRVLPGNWVYGQYARWVYVKTCGRLCGIPVPDGLKRWKPGIREYRVVLATLTKRPLEDTKGERRHILDALAVGIHHAHHAHNWRPENYRPEFKPRVGDAFIRELRRKSGR